MTIPPSDPSAEAGFVSALAEQIHYEFDTSESKPALWWDRDKIDEAQQFDPLIEEAINRSSLFLIVLSSHWIDSEYCKLELELFRKRWSHLDDYKFQHRVILAHKALGSRKTVAPNSFPRQRGFQFFSLAADGTENYFPSQGKGRQALLFRWPAIRAGACQSTPITGTRLVRLKSIRFRRPIKPVKSDAHTVYLAKPAGDMRDEYHRLHEELSANGYNVIPAAEL